MLPHRFATSLVTRTGLSLIGLGLVLFAFACLGRGQIDNPCKTTEECATGLYCRSAVGECGNPGTCQPFGLSITCFPVDDPVCGCDGQTYRGTCDSIAAGQSLDHAGACEDPCDETSACAGGYFCRRIIGTCTGSGTCHGIFTAIERDYLCGGYTDLACGCDGRTYENPCYAYAAGVNVAARGACP